ncbi:MAG: hypothetical protein RBS80_29235 [Thermoguttaceae bacterium]|jgi:hypothetical protein|nr:hypothetical protein [Thermoguttaceae bacterium]
MDRDEEHLRLLAIFHYVFAGMIALFSLFPILHVAIGVALVLGAVDGDFRHGGPPPAVIGGIIAAVGMSVIVFGWTMAACVLAAGRMLAGKRRYLFCLVMAGIECVMMPLGTILGVFTIIVLSRDSVKAAFEANVAVHSRFPNPSHLDG